MWSRLVPCARQLPRCFANVHVQKQFPGLIPSITSSRPTYRSLSYTKMINEGPKIADDEVWCGDGREEALLNHITGLPYLNTLRNNPSAIISEIEEWSDKQKPLMIVGPDKGERIVAKINEQKPRMMVELGGYVGYSAILFGNAVRAAGGDKYISLEYSKEYASVASKLIELAGLTDFVEVIVGSAADSLAGMAKEKSLKTIDILLIDHEKSLYLDDLKVAEKNGLLKPGSLVIADNLFATETNDFSRYVRGGPTDETTGELKPFMYESMTMWFSIERWNYFTDGVEFSKIIPLKN